MQKRNLREELEERERRHFSSKDKSYGKIFNLPFLLQRAVSIFPLCCAILIGLYVVADDRDRRKGNHLLLEGEIIVPVFSTLKLQVYWQLTNLFIPIGTKRDIEDRIIPRSVDADDSDVEAKSYDER